MGTRGSCGVGTRGTVAAPPWGVPPPAMALLPLPERPPPVADMPEEEEPMDEPMPEEEDRPEEDIPEDAEDKLLELSPVPLMLLLPSVEPVPSVEPDPVVPELPEVGKGLEVEAMVTLLCFRTLGASARADGRTRHVPMQHITAASGRPRGAR